MESSCSLQSHTVTRINTSLCKLGFNVNPSGSCRFLKFPISKMCPHGRKLKSIEFRINASVIGAAKISANATEAIPKSVYAKEKDLAFVAGATGKVGSRTVRELLKLGFRVRAGVRSAQKAESLVQSVKQMNLENASEGTQPVEKLELVECDLEKKDQIETALGNASVVICCIGASEKEIFDVTGPYRIDFLATKYLIDAATVSKVDHFILLTSLGTNKVGFPAAILNLFWGVLIWKRKAEEALLASGLPYTIVRPGGMERPTDAYKETHNITLSEEDTLFGGQVSNLQVAELIACIAKNTKVSYCKVVEVIAETTAPLTPMEELLAKISSPRPFVYSPKESESASVEKELDQPKATVAKVSLETEITPTEVKKTRPLSPYACYDDLKPPASPTPTPPSSQKDTHSGKEVLKPSTSDTETSTSTTATGASEITSITEEGRTRPLSPYTAYENLKPPSSPCPTPSGPKETISISAAPVEIISPSAAGNDAEKDPSKSSKYYLSPYHVYDDFKPPTSPSPKAPKASALNSGSLMATISGNGVAQPPVAEKSSIEECTGPKPRPLSPYTMYDDLKPPASPTPSPRKS